MTLQQLQSIVYRTLIGVVLLGSLGLYPQPVLADPTSSVLEPLRNGLGWVNRHLVVDESTTFSGKVVGLSDGDTLKVLVNQTQKTIRLYGIDCPEQGQAFGAKAKQFASQLAFGQVAQVQVHDTDRYGRTVATVEVKGKTLNQELLKAGLAWWYQRYAPTATTLQELEHEARRAKRGLWSEAQPVAPWEFRQVQAKPQLNSLTTSTTASQALLEQPVKFSRSGICHQPGSTYYSRTANFTPFKTMQDCLNAGGRAPLR